MKNTSIVGQLNLSGPVLITGATGFVGAHLCQYFSKKAEVIAVEGSSSASWRLDYLRSTLGELRSIKMDLTSRAEIQKTLRELRPSVILNCAAYGAYPNQTDADRIYEVNFEAVRSLLETARELDGFEAFIQAGSSSEYGLNCTAPKEDAPTLADSHYAVSKVAASNLVRFYALKHGVPAWTFRLYSVFGELEDASRLIPKALLASLHERLPPLVNPNISRDFIFVDDVCRAFEALIENRTQVAKGGIYNIGSGMRTRLLDLVETLRADFGVTETPSWGSMPDRNWDHADWFADPSKAARDFNWQAQLQLTDGLRQTRDWLKANPSWLEKSLKYAVVAR